MPRRVLALLACLLAPFGARADTPQAPRYIVYYDARVSPLADVAQSDFTDVYVSFATVPEGGAEPLILVPPVEMADQGAAVAALKAAGKVVFLSFGGGAMPEKAWARMVGREAEAAGLIADYVGRHGFDGVGVDFEISASFEAEGKRPFDGRAFLVAFTRALRSALPEGVAISHAPQSPYLNREWRNGPYLDVLQQAGDAIDWIAVQYYNNPDFDTPVGARILGTGATPAGSSVAGLIAGAGGVTIPAEKIVVGLPIYKADAVNGHLPPDRVRTEILEPLAKTYGTSFGGLMGWQFSTETADHRYWNGEMARGTPLAR